MERIFVALGSLSCFLAVALGAFGAHALKQKLSPESLAIFEVGVRYHFVHALALFAVAFVASRWPGNLPLWSGICFVAGTLIFSGSLYLLAITSVRWLGAVTPIGGLFFLIGWALIFMHSFFRASS